MMTQESHDDDSQATGDGLPALPQRKLRPRTEFPPRADQTTVVSAGRADPDLLTRVAAGVQNIPAAPTKPVIPSHHALVGQVRQLLTDRPEDYANEVRQLLFGIASADALAYDRVVALRGLISAAASAARIDGDPQTLVNINLATATVKIEMGDGAMLAEEELTKIDTVFARFPGNVDTRERLNEQIQAVRQKIFGGAGSN